MIYKNFKKSLLTLIVVSTFLVVGTQAQETMSRDQMIEQTTKKNIATTINLVGFISGIGGIYSCFSGLLHCFDIPFSHEENIIFTKRSLMSEEDLEKHLVGKKIKGSLEFARGIFLLILSISLMKVTPNDVVLH